MARLICLEKRLGTCEPDRARPSCGARSPGAAAHAKAGLIGDAIQRLEGYASPTPPETGEAASARGDDAAELRMGGEDR